MPSLATVVGADLAAKWRFKLRQGVKFHDGSTFNADDVVFSVIRAQQPTSQIADYANAVGTPKKIDDLTVEFELTKVNPIFLQHVDAAVHHEQGVVREEQGRQAAGLQEQGRELRRAQRQRHRPLHAGQARAGHQAPDKRNPNYWAKHEGNVQDVVFTPIGNDATRSAALVSGELDFILDPPPRDVPGCATPPA